MPTTEAYVISHTLPLHVTELEQQALQSCKLESASFQCLLELGQELKEGLALAQRSAMQMLLCLGCRAGNWQEGTKKSKEDESERRC